MKYPLSSVADVRNQFSHPEKEIWIEKNEKKENQGVNPIKEIKWLKVYSLTVQ